MPHLLNLFAGSLNAVVDTLGNLSTSGLSPSLPLSTVISNPSSLTNNNNGDDILPEGWEERQTENGRSYFVNHVRRTTQWQRPTQPASMATLQRGGSSSTNNSRYHSEQITATHSVNSNSTSTHAQAANSSFGGLNAPHATPKSSTVSNPTTNGTITAQTAVTTLGTHMFLFLSFYFVHFCHS